MPNPLPAVIETIIPEEIPNEPVKKFRPQIAVICWNYGEYMHIKPDFPIDCDYHMILDIYDINGKVITGWTETPYARRNRDYKAIAIKLQSIISTKKLTESNEQDQTYIRI